MTLIALCDLTLKHRVSLESRVLRLATSPFITGAADIPANTAYAPDMTEFPVIEASLFGPARTRGRSEISAGSLVLNNMDGRYDNLIDWVPGDLVIRQGDAGGPVSGLATILTGKAGQAVLRGESVEILVQDFLAGFARGLAETVYLGTNSGTSGNEGLSTDIKGQLKPVALGKCLQVPLVPANAAGQRYQFHDGAANQIIEAYGNGSPLPKTDDAANGLITFTGNIDGLNLTADVRGMGAGAAYISSAANLIQHIAMTRAGVLAVNAEDVAELNIQCPQELGAFYNAPVTCGEAADFIAGGNRVWYAPDATGVLRMGRLTPPATSPKAALRPEMLTGGAIQILQSGDPEGGRIVWRVTVRGQKNWRVAERSALAGSLTDERMAELTAEWRSVTAEDAAIKAIYPDATEISIDTALTSLADMQKQANELLAIYGKPQQWLRVYPGEEFIRGVACGDVVSLTYPRYGLSLGAWFSVMRLLRRGAFVEMDLWRVLP